MAKNNIRDLDATAANNTDIGGINSTGGTNVSNLDNIARYFAKILADVNKGNEAVESTFTLGDSTDITKTFRLVLSGISTSTQRTMTMPDANITWGVYGPTVVGVADSAALTALLDDATTSLSGVGELATEAEFRGKVSGAKFLTPENVWNSAAPVALVDGTSVVLNLNAGINFTLTIAGNRNMVHPTDATPGQSGWIEVTQDATGGRILTFGAKFKFPNGGSTAVLSTGANAVDTLYYTVKATDRIEINIVKDFQ